MSDDTSLQELVLGYCRQVGGLVEPPAYNIYEVLLPNEAASRWGLSAYQRFTFYAEAANEVNNVTYLHYGQELVETIVNELHQKNANGQFFINNVRPEKPALFAAVEKTLLGNNAKLFLVPDAAVQVQLHHYVRYNFKVSLISDEKREIVLPILMDLQNGYSVNKNEIERLAILDSENQFPQLELAAPSWIEENQLSINVLKGLLERARKSIPMELADTLEGSQKRLSHFLELDRARLNDYYADLLKDAERRLQKAEDERRSMIEAKLAAINAERQSKLEDVEQKYHLRIQLELLNLALISQPKLDLTVEIRKRTVSVKRTVTWDPLLHIIELLPCDVCGQPMNSFSLCEYGHLAHTECLAAQCVDCKRTFCQKCSDKVQTCTVCDRPVCIHSLIRCAECGRVTCRDHLNECHAENGQPHRVQIHKTPERLETDTREGQTSALKAAEKSQLEAKTHANLSRQRTEQKQAQKRESARTKMLSSKFTSGDAKQHPFSVTSVTNRKTLGDRIEVYADPGESIITAKVMTKKHEIAIRMWKLFDDGLSVFCSCEKGLDCQENSLIYRPFDLERIELQINSFIKKLQDEYGVEDKKVKYFHIRQEVAYAETKIKLPSTWKDAAVLKQAQAGFDKL